MYYFFPLRNFSKSSFVFTYFTFFLTEKKSRLSEIGRHKSIFKSSDEHFKPENILKSSPKLYYKQSCHSLQI